MREARGGGKRFREVIEIVAEKEEGRGCGKAEGVRRRRRGRKR